MNLERVAFGVCLGVSGEYLEGSLISGLADREDEGIKTEKFY